MLGNIDFPPSALHGGFRRWADKGLKTINQLFDGTEIKSLSQLQEQFRLPSNDLYRYFQICHYITSHIEKEMVSKKPNEMKEYFISIVEKCFPTKKHITDIYKTLITDSSHNTVNIKGKWELELNIIIADNVWEELSSNCHKGINSQMYK